MSTEDKAETGYRFICRERGEHRIAFGLTCLPYCLDCDYEWGD
jgi:hypothetical protein